MYTMAVGTAVPAQRDEAAEDARPVTVWVGAIPSEGFYNAAACEDALMALFDNFG
jgi:hypothetical protein